MSRSSSPSISCDGSDLAPVRREHLPALLDHEPGHRVGPLRPPCRRRTRPGPGCATGFVSERARRMRSSARDPALVDALEAAARPSRATRRSRTAARSGSGSPASAPKRDGLTRRERERGRVEMVARGQLDLARRCRSSRAGASPARCPRPPRASRAPRRPAAPRARRRRRARASRGSARRRAGRARAATARRRRAGAAAGGVEAELAAGAARRQRREQERRPREAASRSRGVSRSRASVQSSGSCRLDRSPTASTSLTARSINSGSWPRSRASGERSPRSGCASSSGRCS